MMQFLRDLVYQRCGDFSSFSPKNLQLPILSLHALDFLKLKGLLKRSPPFPQCPSSGASGLRCPASLLLSVVFQCYSQGNVKVVGAGRGLVLAASLCSSCAVPVSACAWCGGGESLPVPHQQQKLEELLALCTS